MLVLTRKVNESIIINGNIRVVVVAIDARGQVRLGIEAPASVIVDRQEVHLAKKAEELEDQCREEAGHEAYGEFTRYRQDMIDAGRGHLL